MRKLKLDELIKTAAAFTAVSALTVDGGLLFAEAAIMDIPGEWYYIAPLGVWVLVGIPTTIALTERLLGQLDIKPGRIVGFADDGRAPFWRGIKFNAGGKSSTILASSAPHIFGETLPTGGGERRAVWRVPVNGADITVREAELLSFLEICYKRHKHQFSRNYWLRTRRPPLWEGKYCAYMDLLTQAGIVEGRQFGASGRLVCFPREAISFLKYESTFAI